jgi:neutral ceramidase
MNHRCFAGRCRPLVLPGRVCVLRQRRSTLCLVITGTLVFLLVSVLLATAPVLRAADQPGLQAGTAAVDITPDVFPMQLRSGPSKYVHDPLYVRAVAFRNGEGRAAIALMDAIGVGRDWTDEAKTLVAERTGWKPEEMLVCGTHTHSAPKGGDTSPGRIAYDQKRREGLVKALTQAIESLEPAKVGFGSDQEPDEVRNRRWFLKEGTMDRNPLGGFDQVRTNPPRQNIVKPAGPTDPEVCVIDVRTRRGRALGLIANYALHYVGGIPSVVEENGRVVGMASADYFGEFSRVMPYRVGGSNPPENFVALMTNGASGDINNIDFDGKRPPRAPFEQARLIAAKTADAAWRAVRQIETYDQNPMVAMLQREVTIQYRSPSEDDIERARQLMELSRVEREEINKRTSSVAATTLRFAEPDAVRSENVIVQAIRIGDQAIVSMPFEVLVEIGLEIKKQSPFPHTFLIALANGGHGYLPPPHQHELGGYETWLGTSSFEKDTSVILTEHLLEMLKELRNR